MGDDATYSGTVAGAMEATILGVPGVAFSLASYRSHDFTESARIATEVTAETTTTTVIIPNEEMKGRIIGKEGRNIRAFEQLMGVEILIDDSPDTVVISGFNSIRRHIA